MVQQWIQVMQTIGLDNTLSALLDTTFLLESKTIGLGNTSSGLGDITFGLRHAICFVQYLIDNTTFGSR